MKHRRKFVPILALVAMLFSVLEPAVAQCVGCQRGGFFNRSSSRSVTRERHVERNGLFAGRLVNRSGGGLFNRRAANHGSSGGHYQREVGCGAPAEVGCGAPRDSSDDYNYDDYTGESESFKVPVRDITQAMDANAWRPLVALHEIALPLDPNDWRPLVAIREINTAPPNLFDVVVKMLAVTGH